MMGLSLFEEVKKELKNQKFKHADLLEIPPDTKLGDFAIPCFKLAKEYKKNPNTIALDFKVKINASKVIEEVSVAGAYLNLKINKNFFAEKIVKAVLKEKRAFGSGKKSEKIMIEFSQPNTHKDFHVGHDRNTSLGESLSRILKHNGFEVVKANYPGDIGTHVAKAITFLSEKKPKLPESNRGKWLGEIYVKSNTLFNESEDFKQKVYETLQKLEAGDKKLLQLWNKTRKWSLDYFKQIYKEMNVRFDVWFFESDVEKEGKRLVKSLLKKGVAEYSEGAIIIDLKKFNLGVFLMLKSDGSSLYATKDLALAKRKFEEFKVDRSVYVVGSEQRFYFQQLFKALEVIGFKKAKNCYHLSYGLVNNSEGKKFSSRTGDVISHVNIVSELFKRAVKEVKDRNPKMSRKEVEEIAQNIALSSLKYSLIKTDADKSINFNWEDVLSFDGNSAPYLLYSIVRARKILEGKIVKPTSFKVTHASEENLLLHVSKFNEAVEESSNRYSPHVLANYAYELCQIFNDFYNNCRVIGSDEEESRLVTVKVFEIVASKAVELLNLDVPERM